MPRASSTTDHASWRLLLLAASLLAVVCLIGASQGAQAETLQEKLETTRGKLDHVRQSHSSLSATIAEQNRAIDTMLGEVSVLRRQQAAVEGELTAKQAQLDTATARLIVEKERLQRVRERLHRALGVLRQRLINMYEAGSPDMLNVVLESKSWSDVTARANYLSQLQEYDDSVAARVKSLRDEIRAAVEQMAAVRLEIKQARDTIAAKERQVAAARAEAAARFAELKDAQA